jgi:hypothetical protein
MAQSGFVSRQQAGLALLVTLATASGSCGAGSVCVVEHGGAGLLVLVRPRETLLFHVEGASLSISTIRVEGASMARSAVM